MKSRALAIILLTFGIAACGSAPVVTPVPTPQPTPTIIIKTVEIPGPTIEVTPQSCIDALRTNGDLWGLNSDWLTAYSEGDYKKSDTIANKMKPLINSYISDRDACLATSVQPTT